MKNVVLGIVYCFFVIIINKLILWNMFCVQCNVKYCFDFVDVGKFLLWNVKFEEFKDCVGFGFCYIKIIN